MTKILLVDDEPEILTVLRRILEHAGFEVILAGDGQEALATAVQEHPDLLLCDILMPEMSGYEVVTAIRADPRLRHLAVVMVSAMAAPADVARAMAVGADGYLTKPFRSHDLLQEVRCRLQSCSTSSAIIRDDAMSRRQTT